MAQYNRDETIGDLVGSAPPDDWFAANPPPAATPPPPAATGTGTADPQALWQQYQAENPGFHPAQSNPTSLQPFIDWANQHGVQISLAAPSSGGYVKGIMLNGQFIKLLDGSDHPIWQTTPDEASGGGLSTISQLTQPFTEQLQPGGGPAGSYFTAPKFNAPTGEDVLKEPGYQFRLGQGEQALEQSAAGHGVLNTGGTLKDILGYGQNFASQEYGNVWNRALDAYKLGYQGAFDQNTVNYNRDYQRWLTDNNIYNSATDKNLRIYDIAGSHA